MNSRALARSVGSAALLVAISNVHAQTQILEPLGVSLTSYKPSGATSIQDLRSMQSALQRGVNFDGTGRMPSPLGWAINGSSLEAGMGAGRVGEVRFDTGSYAPLAVDIALPAPGFTWVVGRTFNHRQETSGSAHRDSNGPQGKNWSQTSMPEIVLYDADGNSGTRETGDILYIVYGADRFIELDRTGDNVDTFKAKNGAAGIAVFSANSTGEPETYTYTDQRGVQITFLGFDADAGSATGQFWKMVDPAGNTAYVGNSTLSSSTATTGYSSGRMTTVYDSADRRYTYSYSTIDSVSRLTQVKAETKASGSWASPSGVSEVAKVDYAFYQTGDNTNGDSGNLKLVTITTPLTDSGVSSVRKTHYRYWTGTYNSSTNPGHPNSVKYVIDAEGYRAADYADATFNDTPLSMDLSVTGNKAYAALYLEYDSSYRVNKVWQNGACGCGSNVNGVHTIVYGDLDNGGSEKLSSYVSDTTYQPGWGRRAVVTLPDTTGRIYYFDEVGQPLSTLSTEKDPADGPSTQQVTQVIRDGNGKVSSSATPARNDGHTYATGAVTEKGSGSGLKSSSSLVASGDLANLVEASTQQESVGGSSNFVQKTVLTNRTYEYSTGFGVARPIVDAQRAFHTATTDGNDSTKYYQTSMTYDWWSATASSVLYITPKKITVTQPAVSTTNNGSGSANATKRYLRMDGTTVFSEDADGTFSYTAFTNGQLTKQIADCQTNHSTDFASGDDPSSDFGITETSSGTRLITSYAYDPQGRPDSTTLPDGRVTKMYYSQLKDGRLVTISIPRVSTSGTTTYYGPASYSVSNFAGQVAVSGTIALSGGYSTTALSSWIDETDADPITALDVGSLASLSTTIYDESGSRRTESQAYHTIPGSGAGSSGTNYDATTYSYDSAGRAYKTTSPAGTITKTLYDSRGRVASHWIGTVDGGGSDNMVKTEAIEYDNGDSTGKANNLVTKQTRYIDSTTTDARETTLYYDARNRLVTTVGPQAPYQVTGYDNLNRATATALYSSSSGLGASSTPTTTSNRVAYSQTSYDELGRVWKSTTHEITQATGSSNDSIDSLTWFDADGRVIKTKGPGGISKTIYDRLGRPTSRFAIADDGGETSYSAMDDVSGDKVLDQSITHYGNTDTALSGKVQMTASISRWHDDTTTTGPLDTNADGNDNKFTESDIDGRIQIAVSWMDELGRTTSTASYGTNGMVQGGSSHFELATGGTWLSVPSRSDTVLVTTTTYDTAGRVEQVEAPGQPASSSSTGTKVKYAYDAMGRTVAEIRNYTGGSTSTADRDNDLYTRYVYSNGNRTKLWVDLDGDNDEDSDDQVTTYTYGTTKGTSAGDSTVATGHLLFKEQYPDSSDATNDVIKHAYNAQGQEIWRKDQLGCIVQTDYDTGGRVLHRRVTDLGSGSGLDGTVLRISTAYLSRGPIDTVTQYDNATVGSGTAKDQVQYTYDGWGNLTKFEQDVDSTIGASGRAAFSVQYAYTKATPTNGAPAVRRTSMTYPGSAQLNYVYDTGSLNDQASRVYQMAWNSASTTYLARYEYLGGGQVVRTTYPDLSGGVYSAAYDPAGTAHAYANLDRFGRVTHNQWTNGLSGGTSFYDTTITYDRLSNITSTDDATPNGTTPGEWADVLYGLDAVGRLTDADEGKLASGSIATRTRRELWKDGSTLKLSQTGNWLRRKLDTNGDGDYGDWQEVDDTGSFNKANEWLTRDLDSNSGTSTDNYTLTTDAAGNLTNDAKSYKYVYDAFGRMVEAKNQSNTSLTKYRYNGLGHRTLWQYDANSSGTLTDTDRYYFCYDERWRIVATFRDQDSNPKERFVYHTAGTGGYGGLSYIDLCVLRDRDNNGGGGWTGAADSTLEERTYFCQNWRADVVAVASASGYGLYVKQRFKYDSYGSPRFHGLADYHPDGGADITDNGEFFTDFENGNPRADLNFDGGVDINDQLLFLDAFYAGGPDADVRKLYAGYEWDRITRWGGAPGWYHVRHRVLLPELGRWSRRDPAGYVDGAWLETYVGSEPLGMFDPSGLIASQCIAWAPCLSGYEDVEAPGLSTQNVFSSDWYKVEYPLPGYGNAERKYAQGQVSSTILTTNAQHHSVFWNVRAMYRWRIGGPVYSLFGGDLPSGNGNLQRSTGFNVRCSLVRDEYGVLHPIATARAMSTLPIATQTFLEHDTFKIEGSLDVQPFQQARGSAIEVWAKWRVAMATTTSFPWSVSISLFNFKVGVPIGMPSGMGVESGTRETDHLVYSCCCCAEKTGGRIDLRTDLPCCRDNMLGWVWLPLHTIQTDESQPIRRR